LARAAAALGLLREEPSAAPRWAAIHFAGAEKAFEDGWSAQCISMGISRSISSIIVA
jgi:hypothetical protein